VFGAGGGYGDSDDEDDEDGAAPFLGELAKTSASGFDRTPGMRPPRSH
jgi:hypothetical protein